MNRPALHRNDCVFALRLCADADAEADANAPPALSGELEHVMSGRCHAFASNAELLACLALEQRRALALSTPPSSLHQPARPLSGDLAP